jgi:type III pantothenate kinase
MWLLIDIGNTHTHLGLANAKRVMRRGQIHTKDWLTDAGAGALRRWVGRTVVEGVALASVVPRVTRHVRASVRRHWGLGCLELNAASLRGLRIDYPRPQTIGADRLANALAAWHRYGAPVVVVDFGTAVTFDVVDERGCYIGGVIAPGLEAMTDYLHARTALLPRIRVRRCRRVVGRSTEEAMQAGAYYGYPGLVRAVLEEIRRQMGWEGLPVVATGAYARLMAERVPEIGQVCPDLTLEGLRLTWLAHQQQP